MGFSLYRNTGKNYYFNLVARYSRPVPLIFVNFCLPVFLVGGMPVLSNDFLWINPFAVPLTIDSYNIHTRLDFFLAWEPSVAQGTHTYSRRLPAIGRKLRF